MLQLYFCKRSNFTFFVVTTLYLCHIAVFLKTPNFVATNSWKLSLGLLTNIHWFHTYNGSNTVLTCGQQLGSLLAFNSTNVPLNS